jgi:hypothetical protein
LFDPLSVIGSVDWATGGEPLRGRVVIAIKVKAVTGTSVSRERRTGKEVSIEQWIIEKVDNE